MEERLITLLGLRRESILQQLPIPKARWLEREHFTALEKRIVKEVFERITLLGILNEETCSIPASVTDEFDYSEIYILLIELRQQKAAYTSRMLTELIHKAIPNPLVAICTRDNEVLISTARKRRNKGEKGKSVILDMNETPWLALESEEPSTQSYLAGLSLEHFSFKDLRSWYTDIVQYVYQSALIPIEESGFVYRRSLRTEVLEPGLVAYRGAERAYRRAREAEVATVNFNDKLEIHTQVARAEREWRAAKENLRELLRTND